MSSYSFNSHITSPFHWWENQDTLNHSQWPRKSEMLVGVDGKFMRSLSGLFITRLDLVICTSHRIAMPVDRHSDGHLPQPLASSGKISYKSIQPTPPAHPPSTGHILITHQIYAKQTKKLTKYILIQVGFKFPGSKENWKGVNTKVTTEKASILEANLSMPHFFLRPPLFSMGQTYIEIPWGGFTGRSGCQTISIADSSISNDLWSLSCLLHRIASREGHFSPGGFIRALIRLVRWQEVA